MATTVYFNTGRMEDKLLHNIPLVLAYSNTSLPIASAKYSHRKQDLPSLGSVTADLRTRFTQANRGKNKISPHAVLGKED